MSHPCLLSRRTREAIRQPLEKPGKLGSPGEPTRSFDVGLRLFRSHRGDQIGRPSKFPHPLLLLQEVNVAIT
jgi:hypothetical protein